MNKNKITLAIITTTLISSCAEVTVKKIPSRSHYVEWTDTNQGNADAIEGNRYYLPRPFIALNKEFPIKSKSEFIHGYISEDGQSVVIDEESSMLGNSFKKATKTPVESLYIGEEGLDSISEIQTQGSVGGPKLASTQRATPSTTKPSLRVMKEVVKWESGTLYNVEGINNVFNLKFSAKSLTDKTRATVRKLFLMNVVNGQPVKEPLYNLPMEYYTNSGNYHYRGFLKNMKPGTYALGMVYRKKDGDFCEDHFVVGNPFTQNPIYIGGTNSAADFGSNNHDTVRSTAMKDKVKVTVTSPSRFISAQNGRVEFTVAIADITKTAAGDKVKKVTRIGLAKLNPDLSINLESEVLLPISLETKTATKWDYNIRTTMNLGFGEYVIAIHFETDTGGNKETTVLFQDAPSFVVQNVPAPVYDAPICELTDRSAGIPNIGVNTGGGNATVNQATPDAKPIEQTGSGTREPDSTSTTKETVKTGGGAMTIKAIANPNTKPVIDVNEYFKILYLPDFDEQYSVKPKASLSQVSIALSLENGWMMENFAANIDNRAIANFFFMQFGETLDLVRNIKRIDKKLLAPVIGEEDKPDDVKTQGMVPKQKLLTGLATAQVLLKIHKVTYARPGIYPILKSRELIDNSGYGWGHSGHSVIQFDNRTEIIIELVKISK